MKLVLFSSKSFCFCLLAGILYLFFTNLRLENLIRSGSMPLIGE